MRRPIASACFVCVDASVLDWAGESAIPFDLEWVMIQPEAIGKEKKTCLGLDRNPAGRLSEA
jgi:hypothetical protein